MDDLTRAILEIAAMKPGEYDNLEAEMNAERIYFEKRDDAEYEDSGQKAMDYVLDNVAEPYTQLANIADVVFTNFYDEAEIGRLVKKLVKDMEKRNED